MVTEVIDGLKVVAEGIESVKTIAEAVKSGQDYLKATHPEAQQDILAMVAELSKSLFVIKRASAVITNFSFAVATDGRSAELARFNDYFIQSKAEAQLLRDRIEDLRTHCSKIRERASTITASANADGFARIFTLLGLKSPARERDLAARLDRLAYEDFAVANSAEQMLDCLEASLKDVQNSLGSRGSMLPENIPRAIALLGDYGPRFETIEAEASEAVKDIKVLVALLK